MGETDFMTDTSSGFTEAGETSLPETFPSRCPIETYRDTAADKTIKTKTYLNLQRDLYMVGSFDSLSLN